jgi:hypothetical protein
LRYIDAVRLSAIGALLGLPAFACVIFSAPLGSALMFQTGAALIGLGGGLFSVGMLLTAMEMTTLTMRAWSWVLGAQCKPPPRVWPWLWVVWPAMSSVHWPLKAVWARYLYRMSRDTTLVFQTEMVMMFVVLIALGPLVSRRPALTPKATGFRTGRTARLNVLRRTSRRLAMGTGAITQYVDVAQIVLYMFSAFLRDLIYYLLRENHREGYADGQRPLGRRPCTSGLACA